MCRLEHRSRMKMRSCSARLCIYSDACVKIHCSRIAVSLDVRFWFELYSSAPWRLRRIRRLGFQPATSPTSQHGRWNIGRMCRVVKKDAQISAGGVSVQDIARCMPHFWVFVDQRNLCIGFVVTKNVQTLDRMVNMKDIA